MTTKYCIACKETHPLTEFNKSAKAADGRQSYCRGCNRRAVAAYAATDKGKASNRRRAAAYAATDKGKAAKRRRAASERLTNPEKRVARSAVAHAITAGQLVRGPCEVCGTTVNIDGHHEDYSKPLDVNWLCRKHHKERHREIDMLETAPPPETAQPPERDLLGYG
jgi:hypothetical protein